ncbi:MAG TPA: DNA translocase FtsK 4TM domain-containing protein, partial [Flavisolibacter sp.]|nr:DNA translocase FtsK 4TM domain-containing protein [Flavisolibacter sp.]
MANKLKKSTTPKAAAEKPEKTEKAEKAEKAPKAMPGKFKADKEEKVDLKKLARDERTWKIIGTVSLLISIFLFIAFVSYFFTWKEDQDKVGETSFLTDNDIKVSNLLGRLGAYMSHFFIYKGFGIASMLFCTFFFVVGINLLVNRKVFSIWRNLKYVTIGLLIVSVTFAFVFSSAAFPFGGRVGDMISNWLTNFLGGFGTAALLLVVGISYLIWQFNPTFNIPERKMKTPLNAEDIEPEEEEELVPAADSKLPVVSINDLYAEKEKEPVPEKGNLLKGEGGMLINGSGDLEESDNGLQLVVKPTPPDDDELTINEPVVEKEIVDDILHRHDELEVEEIVPEEPEPPRPVKKEPVDNLELEIKTAEEKSEEEDGTEKNYSDLPPYEPTLDLRDYKYPKVDLLETHGSEKIVQDPAELEANKNQIITTLKNYDITIQKISATVGPTVTLYEIVPAAGVRISRIKNLEDDIALSLAALGIRIIAPIPGKGTIGIEVPNVKKTVVSMKTLLASEKF